MSELKPGDRVTHKADRRDETWNRGTVEVVQMLDGVLQARVRWESGITATVHPVANLDRCRG